MKTVEKKKCIQMISFALLSNFWTFPEFVFLPFRAKMIQTDNFPSKCATLFDNGVTTHRGSKRKRFQDSF